MMDRPPSDHDEPEHDRSEPAYCSLLDGYWEDLQRQSAPDSQQGRIDPDSSDPMLARDLEVLNRLHRLQQSELASGDGSQDPTVWALEPFELGPESPAPVRDRPEARERKGENAGDRDPLGGLVSSEREAHAQGDSSGPTAFAPVERSSNLGIEPPSRIGKYVVIEMLDSGGQARVFRVMHAVLRKDFVLKLSKRPIAEGSEGQADTPVRDRLIEEGRLLAQCDHPNLVRVVDLDVHEGQAFVVMEYVPGLTLGQFVNQHRPGPRWVAGIVAELAQAVAYIHNRGIVHQDIKPRNVLIDAQGRPRLIDFGLARWKHAWSDDAADRSGGTAAYMSPEQAMNRVEEIGPRTDVFGLGGLLYYLLTGLPLYRGASRTSVFRQAMKAEYVPVRQLNRRVPRALERICHKALAADPERRYRSATELERALRRFRGRPWIVAAVLIVLSLMAATLIGPRPRPLPIDTFEVTHFRFRDDHEDAFGRIGWSTQPILENDRVHVSARLQAPAYGYLIALNPDGKDQLCRPSDHRERPPRSVEIGLEESTYFPLTDGSGLQVFVAIASHQPLPPYEEWTGRDILRQGWKDVKADAVSGVWEYKDGKLTLISSASRGALENRSEPASLRRFRAVCDDLAKLAGVDAIQAIAFPVRPNG